MKKLLVLFLAICAGIQAENPQIFERIPDRAELEILSPTLAQRQTAKLRLRNGLEVYLISDPEVKQSAAALAVEAGSWDNPIEYPGMAHFLEHMLFMGTAAYPDEGEYMPYIFENGGLVNAYTAEDRTVYMFSINNEAFEGALDRFSHFFIDPLFQQSSINRELHAVDQEHAKNIENDAYRQYMVFKETGNPQHPNAGFSCGNADTLKGIPQEEMKKWYREHYSADKMHLVVTSSLPIDELIEVTVNDFSAVPNNHIETASYPPNMFSENQRGNILYIKPVKDLKILSMVWELPTDLATDQEGQIGRLLSYILSSGSKNSLLGLLKRQHLANAIQVAEDLMSKTNKLFCVDIELSDKGIEQVNTVITYFFETLARLKKTGIPRYVFNEVEKISEIQYQYQARANAFDYVQKTASELVYEDLSTFPRKTLLPTKFNPELTSNYIAYLTPENCIFSIMADPAKTQVTPNRQEKWMGGEYRVVPVAQKQLQAWSQVSINPQIGLPPPNSFIPTNMTLVNSTFSDETIVPSLLQDNDQGKVYFAEDHRYLTPKVNYLFRIKSPLLDGSAQAKAFTALYVKALEDQLFPITSAAELAGSSVLIRPDHFSLVIAVDSYSEPSVRLVEDIFSGIKKIHLSKEQFELFKKSLVSDYENKTKELPFLQSIEMMSSIIFSDAPMSNEKLKAAKKITYEEFLEFSQDIIKKAYIE